MTLITFNPIRALGVPGARYLKPQRMYDHLDEIRAAEWLLFPDHWQVNALAYGLGKRIFPSLPSYHLGHDKVEQTRAFQALCPEHVPDTLIGGFTTPELETVERQLGLPYIAKRIRSAQGEGVMLIERREDLIPLMATESVFYAQRRLPIDRDLRIVVVGERVLTAYWRIAEQGEHRANVSRGGRIEHRGVPEAAIELALHLARSLGIDHAGFDIAMVDGHPYVLEFNRLFGNRGIPDSKHTIGAAIVEAMARHERTG